MTFLLSYIRINVNKDDYNTIVIICQYIYLHVFKGWMYMAHYPRLKDLREDHDCTQKQMAEMLFITQQQYSLYETGYREIPVSLLVILADFYHTTVDYIVGRTDNPKPLG